jgi:hypothetical protein
VAPYDASLMLRFVSTGKKSADDDSWTLRPKALSYRKTKTQHKNTTVRRIHLFVNQQLFKSMKFATNETMVEDAIKLAIVNEFQLPIDDFAGFYISIARP